MTLDLYLTYLAAVAAFFATPPDTSQLLVLSNSMTYGLRRSSMTIVGDLSANAVQIAAAGFGVAALIATFPQAFTWVQWLGVAYLAFIGVQVFRGTGAATGDEAKIEEAPNLFRRGFLMSLSNPFAIMFFGSLFPQFIDTTRPAITQILILGTTYLVVDGLILIVWGWVGTQATTRLHHVSARWIARTSGTLMIVAALLLASKNA